MGFSRPRVLEWVAISFSRGSSWPRDQTQVSCIAGRHFTLWATREAPFNNYSNIYTSEFFLMSKSIPLFFKTLISVLADITKMFLVFPKVGIFLSLFQFYTNTRNSPKVSSILNCLPVLISRALSKWKAKVVTCFLPCFLSNASLGESSLPFNCPSLFSFLLLKRSWQRVWGGM